MDSAVKLVDAPMAMALCGPLLSLNISRHVLRLRLNADQREEPLAEVHREALWTDLRDHGGHPRTTTVRDERVRRVLVDGIVRTVSAVHATLATTSMVDMALLDNPSSLPPPPSLFAIVSPTRAAWVTGVDVTVGTILTTTEVADSAGSAPAEGGVRAQPAASKEAGARARSRAVEGTRPTSG